MENRVPLKPMLDGGWTYVDPKTTVMSYDYFFFNESKTQSFVFFFMLLLFFFINNIYRFYFNAAEAKCYVVAVTCLPVLHYSAVFIIAIIIIIIIIILRFIQRFLVFWKSVIGWCWESIILYKLHCPCVNFSIVNVKKIASGNEEHTTC